MFYKYGKRTPLFIFFFFFFRGGGGWGRWGCLKFKFGVVFYILGAFLIKQL